MLPALPTGSASASGDSPRASTISKAAVCWPAMRSGLIELTTDRHSLLAEPPHRRQRLVEVAVDHDQPRPGRQRLGQLAARHLAGGEHHVARQPGCRRVGRRRGAVLPVEAQTTAARAAADRSIDGQHHAAVLERAGRVRALELQVEAHRGRAPRPVAARGPAACPPRRGVIGNPRRRGAARSSR